MDTHNWRPEHESKLATVRFEYYAGLGQFVFRVVTLPSSRETPILVRMIFFLWQRCKKVLTWMQKCTSSTEVLGVLYSK